MHTRILFLLFKYTNELSISSVCVQRIKFTLHILETRLSFLTEYSDLFFVAVFVINQLNCTAIVLPMYILSNCYC